MKAAPYEYTTKFGKKTVEAATMFDINKTIMRCLTKNLAMFGLGLYIYAGEDLPESEDAPKEEPNPKSEPKPKSEPQPKGKKTDTGKTEKVTQAQLTRLYAITGNHADIAKKVMEKYKYSSSKDILKKDYENIVKEIEQAVKGSTEV